MEFGVHTGGTITHTANWRTKYCGEQSPIVYGFDTFTGLPEGWWGGYQEVRSCFYVVFALNFYYKHGHGLYTVQTNQIRLLRASST